MTDPTVSGSSKTTRFPAPTILLTAPKTFATPATLEKYPKAIMREGDAASFPPRQPRSKRYAPQNMTVHVMQPFLGESLNPCAPDTRPNTWPAAQSSSANADPSVSAGSAAPAHTAACGLPPACNTAAPSSSSQQERPRPPREASSRRMRPSLLSL